VNAATHSQSKFGPAASYKPSTPKNTEKAEKANG
jgi:hypothetical protein